MRTALVNKLVLFAALAPAIVWAADVWDAKPFQNWTQKDVLKIFNNSPWARQARAVIGSATPAAEGRSGQPTVGDASSNDSGVPKGREPYDQEAIPFWYGPIQDPETGRWLTSHVMNQDFVRTAYAKGLPKAVVLERHVLRAGLIPVITMMGMQFAAMMGGAIVVENAASNARRLPLEHRDIDAGDRF